MDIGKTISELAENYDPDKEADGLASRAFLQGYILMQTMEDQNLRKVFKVTDIEQNVDARGDYEHHFTIVTGSGHRVRVTLELE